MGAEEDAEAEMVLEGIARSLRYRAWLSGEEPVEGGDAERLSLFVVVSDAFTAVDPVGVVPDDEYDAEATEVVERLVDAGEPPDPVELAGWVVATFERWFGEGSCSPAQAADIADRIVDGRR